MIKKTGKFFILRITLMSLAGMLFLWTLSIAIHDLVDPEVNLLFLTKILAGGSPASSLKIHNGLAIKLVFYLMLVFETCISLVFLRATVKAYYSLTTESFNKNALLAGLLLSLVKYFLGFVVIASEWFYMWQTSPNTQMKALLMSVFLMIALLITLISE